jgi:hypothetical protein
MAIIIYDPNDPSTGGRASTAFDRVNFYPGTDLKGAQIENTTITANWTLSSSFPTPVSGTMTFYGYNHCTPSPITAIPINFDATSTGVELTYASVQFTMSFPGQVASYTPGTTYAGWTLLYRIDFNSPYSGNDEVVYGQTDGRILTQEEYAAYINGNTGVVAAEPPVANLAAAFKVLLIANQRLRINVPTDFQPVAATGGTAPYTYSIISGTLPTGLTLNSATGSISGTPTVAGTEVVLVMRAVDSAGASGNQTFTVSVDLPSSIIPLEAYNSIQEKISDILGLGDNGYGFGGINSRPASRRNRITRTQWNRLITDINYAHIHVTNTSTTTLTPLVGTPITIGMHNTLSNTINWLDAHRYECHPNQYLSSNNSYIDIGYGTSTRTAVWSREISHKVRVDFPTNKMARYFFNTGGQLTWFPYYNTTAQGNDLDVAWAQFSDYLYDNGNWKYTRDNFLNTLSTTTSTTFTSGTLSVSILAVRDNINTTTSKRIDLTATFRNDGVADLLVDPVSGYWNYGPWEYYASATNTNHISGSQSVAGCYSAQGGFSLDRVQGNVWLYMGVWPTDPPNCQTCNWEWLAFNGNGLIGSAQTESNLYRYQNNLRPYWSMVGSVNLTALTTNQVVDYQIPSGAGGPYSHVAYTYRITKTSATSISIRTYPTKWGTGDTGSSISIANWWDNMQSLWGGTAPTYDGEGNMITDWTLGTGTFTWT